LNCEHVQCECLRGAES